MNFDDALGILFFGNVNGVGSAGNNAEEEKWPFPNA
jgi:hypothetical protein